MSKKAFIATVQLAIVAEDQGDACDAISMMLSETGFPYLLDWAYLKLGTQFQYPTEHDYIIIGRYEEGDFLG